MMRSSLRFRPTPPPRWCPASTCRPSSAPSSTRISASSRRPRSRRSSACSTARSQWIFAFPGRLSVTISAGDRLIDAPREELAKTIWGEVARVTGLPAALPPWQIVRERRATFAATPAQDAKRPGAADPMAQSRPRRRLDRHRPARHHRRRDPLRQPRRRPHRRRPTVNCNQRTPNSEPPMNQAPTSERDLDRSIDRRPARC